MKLFYGLVIFCVISHTICVDLHHVEGRNLDDGFKEITGIIIPTEIIQINTSDSSPQDLVPSSVSSVNVTNKPPITPETSTKFNVSSLLRGQPKPETYLTHSENDNNKNEENKKPSNENNSLIDTEVPSLLGTPIRGKKMLHFYPVNFHQQPLENHSPVDIQDKINDDTELIENGENTEDELRKHKDTLTDEIIPQQQYLAVIVAGTLTVTAITCYVSLWSWRRYLERRYGSRTMLVNAEEFDDPNDIHHFTI